MVEVRATSERGTVVRVFDGGKVEIEFTRDANGNAIEPGSARSGTPTRAVYEAEFLTTIEDAADEPEELAFFFDGKKDADRVSGFLERRDVPHHVERWAKTDGVWTYRLGVSSEFESVIAEVLS